MYLAVNLKIPSVLQLLRLRKFTSRVQKAYWETSLNRRYTRIRYDVRATIYIFVGLVKYTNLVHEKWSLEPNLSSVKYTNFASTRFLSGLIDKSNNILILFSADSTKELSPKTAAMDEDLKKPDSW